MKKETDIPCSACALWNSKAKSFSCNPSGCAKLSEWLLKNAQHHASALQFERAEPQIQYVV
ncbi:MAG TPA: hypothetical protein VJ066_03905 [Candidatus Bathyarchaeia archaeon]|nr:hypothetical protein [Candidatus Bathyarchaeia archaeon]